MTAKKKAADSSKKIWIGVIVGIAAIVIFARPFLSPQQRLGRQIKEVETLHWQGKRVEAVPQAKAAIEEAKKVYGERAPQTLRAMELLLEIYRAKGERENVRELSAQIEKLYQEERASVEELMGPDSPQLFTLLQSMAHFYHLQHDYVQAEALYQEALEKVRRVRGPSDPNIVGIQYQLINVYTNQGMADKSEVLYKEILAYYENRFGTDNIALQNPLRQMAEFYHRFGKEKEAKEAEARLATLRP